MRRPNCTLGLLLLTALGLLFSCKQQTSPEKIENHPEIVNYVSGYTSGALSSTESIRVRLKQKIELEGVEVGDEIEAKLFDFSPPISGKTILEDPYTLSFEPDIRLPSEESYTARLHLNKIVDVGKDLGGFTFAFEILQQSFHVVNMGYAPYDPGDVNHYFIEGYIETADYMQEADVDKILSATQGGKELPVRWEYQGNPKKFPFFIDSVIRMEEVVPVVIRYNGEAMGIDISGTDSTHIPSLRDFELVDVSLIQQPDQFIEIQFSDPLLEGQDLNGLVRFASATAVRCELEVNSILVYPAMRLSGVEDLLVDRGVKNSRGYKLKKSYTRSVSFDAIKPAVRLLGKGVIVPGSDGLVLPFEAVSLRAVDLRIVKVFEENVPQFLQVNQLDGERELNRVGRPVIRKKIPLEGKAGWDPGNWNAYSLDLTDLIEREPGVMYQVELTFRKQYAVCACDGVEDPLTGDMEDPEVQTAFPEWDQSNHYYYSWYPQGYQWEERDNPCHISYYNGSRWVRRNVVASNLGIVAKSGRGDRVHVAVSNLLSAEPEEQVLIELYNFQNQRIAQATTDEQGMAVISTQTKPWLLVARKSNDVGYLRLADGHSLSVSMFDVSGQVVQHGIKGLLYGERGVWRPGDTLFLNFILEDQGVNLPEDHPVSFELMDPRGQVTERMVQTQSMNGFYSFTCTTSPEAPTGVWTAAVRVGSHTFRKPVRIETVKPNRLKISLDFNQDLLTYADRSRQGTLKVRWLHGAKASNIKARVLVSLKKRTTRFSGFESFVFDDITKTYYPEEIAVFDASLNDSGEGVVSSDLGAHRQAPGMLTANFMVRAFEGGGDFSTDYFTMEYAPYEAFVGVRMPQTGAQHNELMTDSSYRVDVVSLDAHGNPVSLNNLDVSVRKISWRWWWDISNENLGRYVSRGYEDIVLEKNISTVNGKGSFDLKIEYPDWGRYLVKIADPEGGHSSAEVFYVDWPSWVSRDNRAQPEGAKIMNLSTDKETYRVGETAIVSFPSSGSGRALVSIEKGSEILDAFWIHPDPAEKTTKLRIPVTDKMAPNVYVHLTLVQPHNQTANDLPIRLYGVKSMAVEDPQTRLEPILEMPETLAPEEVFSVEVSEKENRPMTYTLAVVDEGLLDLTRFRTPDPWSVFYAREALGVKTWDVYDYVLGAYGGKLERLFAIGGDGEELRQPEARANRFKPVVTVLGPFELKGGKKTHHIRMPRYVGSVRTMVVAGQEGAYACTDKTTPVKSPLMILGTLPRVLGPGEKVRLPVSVFAMDDAIDAVRIRIESNELLEPVGSTTQSIEFDQTEEKMVHFELEVAERTGVGTVRILASSGQHRATYEMEIQVRNPNPLVARFTQSVLQPGEEWEQSFEPVGMPGTNEGLIEISQIPPVDFGKRLKYLTRYPYGCAEQTTSAVFPQLYLGDVMEVNPKMKSRITRNLKEAIRKLIGMQHSNGGFRYWSSSRVPDDWISSYTGHFLLEADNMGYALPSGFKSRWINYQKTASRNWKESGNRNPGYTSYYQLQQAYRLYTLALAGAPDLSSMNRFREGEVLGDLSRWRLAAAYVLAGKKEVAKELVSGLDSHTATPENMNATFGSSIRDKAMILETLVGMDMLEEASPLVLEISEALSSETWYSTHTTAYALLAIAKYAEQANTLSGEMEYVLSLDGTSIGSFVSEKPLVQHLLQIQEDRTGKLHLSNTGPTMLYARLLLEGIPVAGQETSEKSRLSITVRYKTASGEVLDPTSIEQGTDFLAEVEVINPGLYGTYSNMALAQIFPSGWEIINTRLGDYSSAQKASSYDFLDVRDDRVYTHFGLNRTARFVVMLNAAYVGRYYLPAVSCEAMYDNTIYAREAGQWVDVVEPGSPAKK